MKFKAKELDNNACASTDDSIVFDRCVSETQFCEQSLREFRDLAKDDVVSCSSHGTDAKDCRVLVLDQSHHNHLMEN